MKRYLNFFLIPLFSLSLLIAIVPAKETLAGHENRDVVKSLAVEKGYEVGGSIAGGGAGVVGGGSCGAVGGGLIGTFLFPGVGTLLGAVLGGGVGGVLGGGIGSFFGGLTGRFFHRKKLLRKVNDGEMAQSQLLLQNLGN